jgi:lipoprotein-anchoring transpeptidase ErfK/SrfK
VAGSVGVMAVALGGLIAGGHGAQETHDRSTAAWVAHANALPAPRPAAFEVRQPTPLRRGRWLSAWAPVKRSVEARVAPTAVSAPVVRLSPYTPEGTANLVVVMKERKTDEGQWVQASLPGLSSTTAGWLPRSALGGYTFVRTRLVISLKTMRAILYKDGHDVFRAPVGVGMTQTPTPIGQFYVRDRLERYASPFYGPVAFGTSARSRSVTDWPAGGFIGIHGTDRPDLIPGRVSHGCVRFRNGDILRLASLMPVGTPILITR